MDIEAIGLLRVQACFYLCVTPHQVSVNFIFKHIRTDEDEDSMSEPETDPDTQSTTSYEDFSKLHPDMLLYKAARARNLPVMREALALGANPNWQDEEEHHQTPLMKAIGSVSVVRDVSCICVCVCACVRACMRVWKTCVLCYFSLHFIAVILVYYILLGL